ncbi:unnamed protein product [Leuciscus chuanchicus]
MPFGYRELRAWPLLPAPLLSLSLEYVSTHVRLKEFYLLDARVLVCARACARCRVSHQMQEERSRESYHDGSFLVFFTRSCAVSSFAVSSNNWLGSGQWVLILLSSVPSVNVYRVHLHTTGLPAWLAPTSAYRPGFITIRHPTSLRRAARRDAQGLTG